MVPDVRELPHVERTDQILHTRRNPVCVASPAKLNLGLRIVGRRDDGYHLIESMFWPLDFGDEIELSSSKALSVSASWDKVAPRPVPEPPQQRENLVFRAAEKALGPNAAIEILIRKRIPIGSGLGGGSSNAGSLLRHFAGTGQISDDTAEKAALALGADVPFFLTNQPAWVEGIGEKRTVLQISDEIRRDLTFLLVVPPTSTPTPIIFSHYRSLRVPFAPPLTLDVDKPLDWVGLKRYLQKTENSLQGIAAMQDPLVADILSQLKRFPSLYTGLSGTGSTCFAAFQSPERARKIAKDLEPFCRNRGCQSILARTHNELS